MKKVLMAMILAALLLPVSQAISSDIFYFTVNNAGLVGGPWATITLSQTDTKTVHFKVDPTDSAFQNLSNFGLQSFYFNENTGFGNLLSINNTSPSIWSWNYSEDTYNSGGGYGKFDFISNPSASPGQNRANPLEFDVVSPNTITLSNFEVELSTLGYLFAGHIAGFGMNGITSAKFSTPGTSVPEAGALLLFGTGLVGLVGYRRVRRMQ